MFKQDDIIMYFKDIAIGATFTCNGNKCIKKSTRTALIVDYNKVFYYSGNTLIKPVEA